MRAQRVIVWVTSNLLLWAVATALFGFWVHSVVQTEFETGARTAAEGDAIMIPIVEFAMLLAVVLLVANSALVAVRMIQRRRSRPVI